MKIEILGSVQDGGVPHLGCNCDLCEEVRENPEKELNITSLLLKEDGSENSVRYLIEATPDIRYQVSGEYLDGVFVPYAQIGNITGLLFFGQEGLDSRGVNVYCNQHSENFLMKNDPFRYLVDRGNIETHLFEEGDVEEIQGGTIKASTHPHPHINEETTAYTIEGEEKTLFYLSDIVKLDMDILDKIREADIAIVDGTFWSEDEIDRYDEVPHPTIQSSMEKMEGFDTEIYFTHMNHTNPVLREGSEERQVLKEKGFKIARKGKEIQL